MRHRRSARVGPGGPARRRRHRTSSRFLRRCAGAGRGWAGRCSSSATVRASICPRSWPWRRPCRQPIVTTFKGKGLVSDHHPLGCGVLGRSGTPVASWMMNESDAARWCSGRCSPITPASRRTSPSCKWTTDRATLGRFPSSDSRAARTCRLPRRPVAHARRRRHDRYRRTGTDPEPTSPSAGPSGGPRRNSRLADDRGRGRQQRPRCGALTRQRRSPCRHRGRRRQQHILVRPLLRMQRASSVDVRIPRINWLRPPGRDGRMGRVHAAPPPLACGSRPRGRVG